MHVFVTNDTHVGRQGCAATARGRASRYDPRVLRGVCTFLAPMALLVGCMSGSEELDAGADSFESPECLACEPGALSRVCGGQATAGLDPCVSTRRCVDGAWTRLDQECPYPFTACDSPAGACAIHNPDPACTGHESWCCAGKCPADSGVRCTPSETEAALA